VNAGLVFIIVILNNIVLRLLRVQVFLTTALT